MTKITPFWMRNAFLALLVFGVTLPFFQSLVSGTAIPIQKRNERVPDDATKWAIVLDWMEENNIQEEKMVFFSRGDDNKGLNDAKAFVDKNTDYTYFWKIFDSKFVQDFGEPDITNSDVAKACSIAMASHSSGEARVFNHNNAKDDSYWLKFEFPLLKSGPDPIWAMNDGTLDPDDHPEGNLNTGTDSDTCNASYKFFLDTFEIRGTKWPKKMDADGNTLLDEINKCAGPKAVTKWHFELAPDNDNTNAWLASGQIVIGQKSCVGNAVVTAGGPTKGSCTGAG